ncbi:MAG: hypothetical protein RIT81_30890 [Deltaproteobacteria bacterium]
MKKRRRRNPNQRGFALFIVVLVVALVAVAGGTLLDMVNVDLVIAGEHRKAAQARAVAIGGAQETMADTNLTPANMPIDPANNSWVYATDQGGLPRRDPLGISSVMDETNSTFVKNPGNVTLQESYTSNIRLLRLGPALDTSVDQATAVFYEVQSVSTIGDGAASKEVRAEIYRIAQGAAGRVLEGATGVHAR